MTAEMLGSKLERYEASAIEAVEHAKTSAREMAEAERDYRRAWSIAYASSEAGSHAAKKAEADAVENVERLRHEATLTAALWTAALENSRTRRAVLSSAQTYGAMVRAEAELSR